MQANISISDAILTAEGYTGEVDLSEYQRNEPRMIRVYDDGAGVLVVDPPTAHWLLAEVLLPAIEYQHETFGEGEEQTETVTRLALNDEAVEVTAWVLP